jgi:hypothetical protein
MLIVLVVLKVAHNQLFARIIHLGAPLPVLAPCEPRHLRRP